VSVVRVSGRELARIRALQLPDEQPQVISQWFASLSSQWP
jgi:hypothetical protein